MREILRKTIKSKVLNEHEIAIRIENDIKFTLENKRQYFTAQIRKDNDLFRKNYINKSILFEAIIQFYTIHLCSSNTIIKLKYIKQPISKQILLKCLNYYILKTIKNIPQKCFIHKPSFISEKEFNEKIIFDQVMNIINNYSEDSSGKDLWNIMIQDIKYAIEVQEYKEKHVNISRGLRAGEPLSQQPHRYFRTKTSLNSYKNTYQHNHNENFIMYPLLYGTSRNPIRNDSSSVISYGNDRNSYVSYGECLVKVEKSNKLGGEINKSFLLKLWDTIFNNNSENRKISLQSLEHLDINLFRKRLKFLYSTANEDEMLVYIHGYKNSFKDAAARAAQIAYDLKFPGVTSFFSWASANDVLKGYTADEATAEISCKHLYAYILNIWQNSSTKKIHIIAHSMGNRIFMNTLKKIQEDNSDIKFGHIILVAPDIDTELFKDNSYLYGKYSEMSTLYVSPDDDAIRKSYNIHKGNRVGLSPPVVVEKGIYTINVNQLMTRALWDFGHSYYAEAEALLYDLHELILHSATPDRRQKLEIIEVGDKKYWQLCIE